MVSPRERFFAVTPAHAPLCRPDHDARAAQRWPWWPLLPLYPYGHRRTLVRELIPGRIWSFEQLQGVWYVAVPIRMTVLKVADGLMLYAPVAVTAEVRHQLRQLVALHGPVRTIVLPTASGLEHKLPVPAMARAFPEAEVWITPHQWSFPLALPPRLLGFPAGRTRVLGQDGLPHADQLRWLPLGPLNLGLGTFLEYGCFDQVTGALLLTDALVAMSAEPPPLFDADPTPLLFHARDRGDEPLLDSVERRRRGWQRLVLFANYLRPAPLDVATLAEVLSTSLAPGCRHSRAHFGLYPFRWRGDWQADVEALLPAGPPRIQVAAVLERLVFPRARPPLLAWLRQLASLPDLAWLIPAHYEAPLACSGAQLDTLASELEARPWAPSAGNWAFLAGIDRTLLRYGLVPSEPAGLAAPPPGRG